MFSPIALCCVLLKNKNTKVSENDINQLFKDYASVSKILIFQREPTFKCFIEFSDTVSFEKALRNLDKVSNIFGKVSLYHSKKESLKNAFEFPNNLPVRLSTTISKPTQFRPKNNLSFNPFDINSPNALEMADVSCEELNHLHDKNYRNVPTPNSSMLSTIPLLTSSGASPSSKSNPLGPSFFQPHELKFLHFDKPTSLKPNPGNFTVLLIQQVKFSCANHKLIQNIIGCFGNLIRMLVNHSTHSIIVEMENSHQANLVHIYLHDLDFFGSSFIVSYTCAAHIKPSTDEVPLFLEFVKIEERSHRFKKYLPIKFNPPSPILHLTSISLKVDYLILYDLICQIHEPLTIFKLVKQANKSDMYLVEFKSVRDSLEVLAVMHNKVIDDKSIKISFSHPEIN